MAVGRVTAAGSATRVVVTGPALPVQTCARRLRAIGAKTVPGATGTTVELAWPAEHGGSSGRPDLECAVSWWGPTAPIDRPGGEALVQAACGLMHLHGRDFGAPRRIGVEIASVGAGMLAAQAVLAMAIGRHRGVPVGTARTSVLQAGLLQASHYLAAATCPPEPVPPAGPAAGPPFRTSDGHWFEIETFDAESWKAFWSWLGAPASELGRAWALFRPRYYRGTTSLPYGFHEATAAHCLEEVAAAARDCRVSLCPVRGYEEVLAEPGRNASHPIVDGRPAAPPAVASLPLEGARPALGAEPRPLPLAGIEVVEATSRMQGPLAGLLLQMLGARVTRIETPGGDIGRGVPPLADGTGSFFLCFNRGKDTVEIDLEKATGRAELAQRAAGADVFLHNWRPGKADEWGLSGEDLTGANTRLVYTEASGWDAAPGPGQLIGTDFLVQAYSGLGYGINPDPEPPFPSRVLLTDFMGALVTCEGVLSGLYRREQTGHGCRVRTSLLAGAMTLQAHVLDGVAEGREPQRWRGRPLWGRLDVPLEASDGLLVLDAADEHALHKVCELCHVETTGYERPTLEWLVAERVRFGPVEGWLRLMSDAGIGCARVVTDLATLPEDPCLSSLFEPLGRACRTAASPWQVGP